MQDDPKYGRYKSTFLSDLGRWWDSLFLPSEENRRIHVLSQDEVTHSLTVEQRLLELQLNKVTREIDRLNYKNPQDDLIEFHHKFGLTINTKPTIVEDKDKELRINLIKEEFVEFVLASGYYIHNDFSARKTNDTSADLVEIADAIADLLYVVYGAAVTYGLDAEMLFNEVHRSNMTKVWEDGTVHRREEDGKILKPPTYSKADIKKCLDIMTDLASTEESVKEIEGK